MCVDLISVNILNYEYASLNMLNSNLTFMVRLITDDVMRYWSINLRCKQVNYHENGGKSVKTMTKCFRSLYKKYFWAILERLREKIRQKLFKLYKNNSLILHNHSTSPSRVSVATELKPKPQKMLWVIHLYTRFVLV